MSSFTISPCATGDVEQLRPLLAAAHQKPYRFLARELGGELDDFWLRDLAASAPNTTLLLAHRAGQSTPGTSVGMAALAPLPWETRILGLPMATLKHLTVTGDYATAYAAADELLQEAMQRAAGQGFHSLLCKVYTDDVPAIHALQANGFLLVDTLLDYIYDSRRADGRGEPAAGMTKKAGSVNVRLAAAEDEAELLELARTSFVNHFGRFHSDPRLSKEEATTIYVEWIRSCLAGYADWIPVVEIDGKLAGYSAWKRPSAAENSLRLRVGHYSIAAIHPAFSGRGLFSILTQFGMGLLAGLADVIEGPTHINNYPVQRGYANLGWRIGDARHSFHKWLAPK